MMNLRLLRYSTGVESTLGLLFNVTHGVQFLCFTIEDQYQTKKVYGETRIPAGTYDIQLKLWGGFHERYSTKFPLTHKGMLHLQDVPGFEDVLIHIGNKDDDSAGCILVGNSADENLLDDGFIGQSTAAYKRIYPDIASALSFGDRVVLEIIDYDGV
jgi:hypothetical protein